MQGISVLAYRSCNLESRCFFRCIFCPLLSHMAIEYGKRCDFLGGVCCWGRGFSAQVEASQMAVLHACPPPLHSGGAPPQTACLVGSCTAHQQHARSSLRKHWERREAFTAARAGTFWWLRRQRKGKLVFCCVEDSRLGEFDSPRGYEGWYIGFSCLRLLLLQAAVLSPILCATDGGLSLLGRSTSHRLRFPSQGWAG